MMELLEVDKYPVEDLFYASLFRISAGKLQLDMLEHPFFSLQSRGRDMSTLEYVSNDGTMFIRIAPSAQGRATMKDSDFVAYLQAKLVKMKEEGRLVNYGAVSVIVEVSEFLEFVNRNKSGANYKNFKNMLLRLAGTRIEIDYPLNEDKASERFKTILHTDMEIIRSRKGGEPLSFQITVSDWFVKPIIDDNRFLTMPREYFRIKRDVHKRFFQIARKHTGGFFEISWEKFYNKVGTPEAFSKFRSKVRKEFKDNGGYLNILDFQMCESKCGKKIEIKALKRLKG